MLNNKTSKKLLEKAVKWWSKNGKYKSVKNYGEIRSKNYDVYDEEILAFANYWADKNSFMYNVNYIKGMMVVESNMGFLQMDLDKYVHFLKNRQ